MPAEGLVASGLRRRYGARLVVDGLDLEVRPGEVVGLLGPNGAGKTTTVSMLAGVLKPDAGRVMLGGQDITAWPLWRRARAGLGYVPQEPSIFRRLSVRDNVRAALEANNRAVTAEVELLARFGLTEVASTRGERLSGGERRRTELCRAWAAGPQMLLCDEPFAALDPRGASEVAQQLRSIAQQGAGVLLTDHNVRQTFLVCDRVYIVAAGVVLVVGVPSEIMRDAQARALYLGDWDERLSEND